MHPAQSCDSVGGQGPARHRRRAGEGADQSGREAVQDGPVAETVALLDAGTGSDHRLGSDRAAVADDRARLDDATAADGGLPPAATGLVSLEPAYAFPAAFAGGPNLFGQGAELRVERFEITSVNES